MNATNRPGSLGEADATDSLVAMSRLIEWTGERFVPWVSDAPIAYEHVHRYLWAAELVSGRRVLDLGSGEGFGSALLAHSASRVQGVDIDPLAVEHARAHYRAPNLSFDVADARQLDVFEEASFGAVVCFEVIEHLREQEVLLDGVARVLAPDGLLIVSTPDREAYNRSTGQPNDFHERELSESEFRDLLSERFPHVGLWGQSLAMGSRLAARGEGEPTTQRFFVERRDTAWVPTEEPGAVYLVAVAARAALPAAPVESVLVDSGVMIISQLEAKVAELHEVNSAFGESIDAIKPPRAQGEPPGRRPGGVEGAGRGGGGIGVVASHTGGAGEGRTRHRRGAHAQHGHTRCRALGHGPRAAESRPGPVSPLPRPVSGALDRSLRTYWLERVAQHTGDSYAGVPISKFPEDLRVYEHLLWESRADAVVELGTQHGASALWFRDRLMTQHRYGRSGPPTVVTVDIDTAAARDNLDAADPAWRRHITLLEADVRDPALRGRVAGALPPGARCLVVEDSAHVEATTRAALDGFHDLVPRSGFFVVEDGCVDVEEMRLDAGWPRGVLPAVHEWLGTDPGRGFRVRRDLELYGITCHPEGYLQRTAE